ncbi:MAG: biopolymer transporter ExbD [Bacteroidetes bacterium]|nr:MAG: biopolymer transporter ExbD [Bacteroidota bacterium]
MPKIKVPKKSPSLDMTPMVDLAFLLVTFFMLTTKFRPTEPVTVDQPSSVSEVPLPDKGVILLTVDAKGRVFFNIEGQQLRADILDRLATRFNLTFTDQEKKQFTLLTSIGMPSNKLKEYLNAESPEQKIMNEETKGIPIDSANNELTFWVNAARNAAPTNSIAINGDGDADIPTIKRVIEILQNNKANRFALITNLESSETAEE